MNIEKERKKLELTQRQFAELLGVHFTTLNRWIKGKHAPAQYYKKTFWGTLNPVKRYLAIKKGEKE